MTSDDPGDVEARIRDMVARHFKVEVATLRAETRLREDLGGDSLDLVLLVHDVEDAFDVVVPQESLTQVRTIGDARTVVERLQGK